jgi:hypothetical protein
MRHGWIKENGVYYHWVLDKLHRVDGPAVINEKDKVEEWYLNGQRHRIGGPAFDAPNVQVWMEHNQIHRIDGPAYFFINGKTQYFIRDQEYTESEFNFWSKLHTEECK